MPIQKRSYLLPNLHAIALHFTTPSWLPSQLSLPCLVNMNENLHPIAPMGALSAACGLTISARNKDSIDKMAYMKHRQISVVSKVILLLLMLHISACAAKVKDNSPQVQAQQETPVVPLIQRQGTTFLQIHTNLNGMVSEFVRTMFQDKQGNYWFGTNGNGIIRYDGQTLEMMVIEGIHPNIRVMEIVEDKAGHVWFGTSDGLLQYDGKKFTLYAKEEGLPGGDMEIWSLAIDQSGRMWVGSMGGLSHFDGKRFTPFPLPETKVENRQYMLSDKLVFKILEDREGAMWFATDGNGIFKYKQGEFMHLSTQNGLTDNNTSEIFEDKQGNIWIGTFYGGVSRFDGKTFTNFTKDGTIEGEEAYNFCEDRQGNMWFSAEGQGVYRYDGNRFTHFTTENGLTTDVVQSIFEDQKGQLWFGTWQGICIYDGQNFVDANIKEPWTK